MGREVNLITLAQVRNEAGGEYDNPVLMPFTLLEGDSVSDSVLIAMFQPITPLSLSCLTPPSIMAIREIETSLVTLLSGGPKEGTNIAASKSMLHLVRLMQLAVLGEIQCGVKCGIR